MRASLCRTDAGCYPAESCAGVRLRSAQACCRFPRRSCSPMRVGTETKPQRTMQPLSRRRLRNPHWSSSPSQLPRKSFVAAFTQLNDKANFYRNGVFLALRAFVNRVGAAPMEKLRASSHTVVELIPVYGRCPSFDNECVRSKNTPPDGRWSQTTSAFSVADSGPWGQIL